MARGRSHGFLPNGCRLEVRTSMSDTSLSDSRCRLCARRPKRERTSTADGRNQTLRKTRLSKPDFLVWSNDLRSGEKALAHAISHSVEACLVFVSRWPVA